MAAAGENAAARRSSREISRFSLHHGECGEAPCARPRLRRRWRERPRSGGTGSGPGGCRREGKRCYLSSSPPVLPLVNASHFRRPPCPVPSLRGWRLRAPRCGRCHPALRTPPPPPPHSATTLQCSAQDLPLENAGDIPAALPGSAACGDVLADEFSLANILQATDMKLAALKRE